MIAHGRAQLLATRAIDFDLSEAERREVAAHLAGCPDCRRLEAALLADAAAVRAMPKIHAPDRVRRSVLEVARTGRPAFRMTPLVRMAGEAALVLALLAGFALLGRFQAQQASHPSLSWTRLADTSAFGNAVVSDVYRAGGSQLIAVGWLDENGHHVGAVWSSFDGLAWNRISDDATFMDAIALRAAAIDGQTLAVLGQASPFGSASCCGATRVWLLAAQRTCDSCSVPPSPLLGRWETAKTSFEPSRGSGSLYTAIAAAGSRFVLTGTASTNDAYGGSPIGAAVATSVDGSSWTFADPTSPVLARASMNGIAGGHQAVIAVGDTGGVPTIWSSTDGVAWRHATPPGIPATAQLLDVAATDGDPPNFVIVGDDGASAASWVLAPDESWRVSPSSAALANATMTRVFWGGSPYIAVGRTSGGDGVAWTSLDGLSWTRLDTGSIFAGAPSEAAGRIGAREVLFATDGTGRLVVAVSSSTDP